jgi:4-amino-4-deoxy-L-arabinose transferase-like glycosyltransferase
MNDASRANRGDVAHRVTSLGILAALAILGAGLALFLHRLDAAEICGANEAVEALAVQRMVERGQLLFPVETGGQPMYKPPLFHWTATAIDQLLGQTTVTAFNLRLASAAYGLAGVALTMAFAATILRPSSALLSGLFLLASYQYVSQARFGRVDMTLTFFETLALFLFLLWVPDRRDALSAGEPDTAGRREAARWLLAVALGCAVLAKGPVGALLPLLAIGVWSVVARRTDVLPRLVTPGTTALTLGIAASWYGACLVGRHYGVLGLQIGAENFGRFFGALGRMPSWYYANPLLLNSVPLSLLVPFAVFAGLRARSPAMAPGDRQPGAGSRANRAVLLLAIFWTLSAIFFSIAAYKRKAYLLPLWPAAAVLLAWWSEVSLKVRFGRSARRALAATCVAMIIFNFFFMPWKEKQGCEGSAYGAIAAAVNHAAATGSPLFLYEINDGAAPLSFYLDRKLSVLNGPLTAAPAGFILTTPAAWRDYAARHSTGAGGSVAPDGIARSGLSQVLTISGPPALVLLRSQR